ncbi:unnamed protein product [Effrenium voratum]|nr:unnamed protein product [Effrenium voratum]
MKSTSDLQHDSSRAVHQLDELTQTFAVSRFLLAVWCRLCGMIPRCDTQWSKIQSCLWALDALKCQWHFLCQTQGKRQRRRRWKIAASQTSCACSLTVGIFACGSVGSRVWGAVMGCSSSQSQAGPIPGWEAIEKEHPARFPCLPGDVLISGNLPKEVVFQLAGYCKGWLYIDPEQDELKAESIFARSCSLQVVPFKPGRDTSISAMHKMFTAISQMPRPLMIQCSSANRAAVALLLWMAIRYGYSRASVDQLLLDLELNSVRSDAKRWLESQLPEVGKVEPLISRSPEVTQLYDKVTTTLTYVIACPGTKEALLIDPVLGQVDRDLELLQSMGCSLKYVLNTQSHPELGATTGRLRQKQPKLRTVISEASGAEADIKVHHGQRIALGKLRLEVRGTPGHTTGCITCVLRTGTASFAFTGSTLLIRSCGKTDQGFARQLYRSVHEQIFTLPGDTIVCPGHDSKGRSVSTVQEERRFNRRLTECEEDFVNRMEKRFSSPQLCNTSEEMATIVHDSWLGASNVSVSRT